MYNGKSVSVILATYKEKQSIRSVINDFWKTNFVDEIIVVNNNAEKGTDEEVKGTRAKIIYEKKQGYGYAYQKGLKEAKGDLIVICEPDGSFSGLDLEKFLVFSNSFDVVFGSRTSLIPALSATTMGVIRKVANVFEAKSIEVLFNSTSLTDVGCTYKLLNRKSLNKLKTLWGSKSPLLNTELTLLVAGLKIPFVEIPVRYHARVGKSQIIGSWFQELEWAIKIQAFIFYYWFKFKLFRVFPKN
jgi:glycosyltransferase involved in cell wall biosynthesis